MKTQRSRTAARRGAVATVLVLIVCGLLMGLVGVGLDSVRRARRGVRAMEELQAKRWQRQSVGKPL